MKQIFRSVVVFVSKKERETRTLKVFFQIFDSDIEKKSGSKQELTGPAWIDPILLT